MPTLATAPTAAALRARFPAFSEALCGVLAAEARTRDFDAGEVVMAATSTVRSVPLIVSGAVEVTRVEPDGAGEVLLYYLEPGETCAASLACCTGRQASPIRARATLASRLLLVPVERVEGWMARYPTWRAFVLQTYAARFDELLGAVDALAFGDLRARLAANLLDKRRLGGDALALTHRQLAAELNTSRVVVTRLLRALEREGAVALERGRVGVVDEHALAAGARPADLQIGRTAAPPSPTPVP